MTTETIERVVNTEPVKADTWAICELMGHVKLAGKLTEVEMFGAKMGRLDIPDGEGFVTQLFGGGSVYRITIVTEAVARQVCRQTTHAPVSPWDFPKQLPSPVGRVTEDRTCTGCGYVIEECECEQDDYDDDDR